MDSVLYPRDLAARVLDPPAKPNKAWSVEHEKWRRAKCGRQLGYMRRAFVTTRKGVRRAEHQGRPLAHFVPDTGDEMIVHEDELLMFDTHAIRERKQRVAEERLRIRRRRKRA